MEYAKLLLEKSGKVCKSFYKLHQQTGYAQSHISEARAGKRPIPLEWVPVLAEICGEDPKEALARCMAERLPEGSRARAILGEARAAIAAVMLLFFVGLGLLLPSQGYAMNNPKLTNLYIVEYAIRVLHRIFGVVRSFRSQPPRLRLAGG